MWMKLDLIQDYVCVCLRVPQTVTPPRFKAEYRELLQLAWDRRPPIWFFLPMGGKE